MRQLLALLIVTIGFAPATHAQFGKPETAYRHDIQSYQLEHSKAGEIVEILNEQFPSMVKFSGNATTNTVYARVPGDVDAEVRDFIERLEQDAAKSSEQLKIRLEEQRSQERARWQRRTFQPNDAVQERQKLLGAFGPNHPVAKAVEAQIGQTKTIQNKVKKRSTEQADSLGYAFTLNVKHENDAERSAYEAAEREAAKLADRARREQARGRMSDAKKLREQVGKQVALAFNLRQKIKKNELAQAAAKLSAIRERLDARQQIANQIVERRVEDLLSGVDLSWLSAEDRAANADMDRLANESTPKVIDGLNSEMAKQMMGQVKKAKGPVQIEVINELGTLMLRGEKKEVENVMQVIKKIGNSSQNQTIRGNVIKTNETESSVLLSIGTDNGLRLGLMLDVTRKGKPIGRLKVVSVAPKDSIARILTNESDVEIEKGDEVRVIKQETKKTTTSNVTPPGASDYPKPKG